MRFLLLALLAGTASASTLTAASLIGQPVTGSLTYDGDYNFFAADPKDNGVGITCGANATPRGPGSPTVIVSAAPPAEFCYNGFSFVVDWADFDADSLTISRYTDLPATATPFQMQFVLPTGLFTNVTETSDAFYGSGLTFTFIDDVLTVNSAGGNVLREFTYTAHYAFDSRAATPEPSTGILVVAVMLAAVLWRQFHRGSGRAAPRKRIQPSGM